MKKIHELAVGIKDAYEAGGSVPMWPPPKGSTDGDNVQAVIEPATGSNGVGAGGKKFKEENGTTASATAAAANNNNNSSSIPQLTKVEWEHQHILFGFMGSLIFLLALVDEVVIGYCHPRRIKRGHHFSGIA